MDLRRSWNGLEVALVATRAGVTRTAPSRNHALICHVGRPVPSTIDLVPAGDAAVWEADRASLVLLLGISPELLGAAATRAGEDATELRLAPRLALRDPRLEHLARAFEAELRAAASDPLYGDSLAMAVAAHLVRQYRTTTPVAVRPTDGGLSPRQLRKVTEHIELHVDRRLPLPELAAVAGVSASHFKAQFKRSTGLPVHQYVIRRRVERARLLLLESTATIADVAAQTGFANQSHLARWMRRVAGMTPTDVLRGDR